MKLRNISLLLAAVSLIAVMTLALVASSAWASEAAATPKAGPTAYMPGAVEIRNVSTPVPGTAAGPAPSVTVAPATGAVSPPGTAAEVANYGTSSDTFKRGERATGFVTIKNTGNTPINDVTASVSASAKLPVVGMTSVGNKDYTFDHLNIQPGETKRVEFAVDIPAEYRGVSTAGTYDLHVAMKTGGQEIGSFSKTVKVA